MIQRIPRWARWMLVLLIVLLALYLVIYTALRSTAFSRFALDRVEAVLPELAFNSVEGSFAGGLQFGMRYSTPGTDVQVDQGRLKLAPNCFWRLAVCIDSLRIETLRIALSSEGDAEEAGSTDTGEGEDIALPEITLPVNIFVESLSVASLIVEQDSAVVYELSKLDSALAWRQSTLDISHLKASDQYCHWALEGDVTLMNHYPLSLNLACDSAAGYGEIVAEATGDLQQLAADINARVRSEYTATPARVQVAAVLGLLDANLPIEVNAITEEAVRVLVGEQAVDLESAQLSLRGPLLSPAIDVQLIFETLLWPGQNTLDLEAAATTEELRIQSLALQLPEGRVNANGELAYGEAVAWNGELAWQNIRLEQFTEAVTGELSGELSSQLNYADGDLRAHLDLRSISGSVLENPLEGSGEFDWQNEALTVDGLQITFENPIWRGQSTLSLEAVATTEQLTIQSLALQLPEGRANATGELAYGEALSWAGRLAWENVDLAQFDEAFAGELSGELASRLNYADDLRAHVDLETVTGTWLERRLTASGRFDWRNETLAVEGLRIQQGDNRIQVTGDFSPGDRVDMAVQLNLPAVGDLIPEAWAPDASGELRGDLNLAGSLNDLVVESDLSVNDVQYGDLRLARGQLQLQWFGVSQRRGQIDLRLEQLAVAEGMASDVRLQGQGNIDEHTLELELNGLQEHEDKSTELQCHGGFVAVQPSESFELWQGNCDELMISFALDEEQQTWRLESPISLEARPQSPAFTVSSFCLTNEPASLCSRETINFAQGDLSGVAMFGEDLPAEWLQAFLPGEDLSVAGSWQFHIEGEQLLAAPQLDANVSSSNLTARWQADRKPPVSLNVTDLDLDWRWVDQKQKLSWRLQTEASGSSRGELNIDQQQLAGNLTVTGLQLANYSRLFLTGPEDDLAGQIDAELNFNGSLQDPLLNGQLSLSDGRFSTGVLPVPLRSIQLRMDVEDNRAVADGSFRAADSDGKIGGEFVWGQESWSGELLVSAEPMLIQPEPGMRVSVAPDLEFNFAPQRITIAGQVRVPEAQVEITELPEQAETVSSDAVIVEGQEEETESPVPISTNIEIVLGDKVNFEGFGLETRVTGNLRLQQSGGELLKANGKLQLVEGRYKAYGQNLVIRSGDLVFVGDIDNPQLRLEAVRADTPEDVTVGLRVSGPARNPQVSLFSRPEMRQQAQLSYLLTGNPPGTTTETDPQTAAAEAALSYALESDVGAGIARRAGDALGIEDFRVTAGATDNGAQIGLSGYITPNLLVRYGVGVFEAINTVTLRYQMTKNLYLEAISGEGSDIGIMWSFERN